MKTVLEKCEIADFEFLIGTLNCWFNLAVFDNNKLKDLLAEYCNDQSKQNHKKLLTQIEGTTRYLGSHDIAYVFRWMFKPEAGVKVDEIIRDIAFKLKIKLRAGTTEARLERLVRGVVEKTLSKLKPADLRKLFEENNVGPDKIEEFFTALDRHVKHLVFPVMIQVIGVKTVSKMIPQIVVPVIAAFIGREAAKQLVKELAKRFPWWAEWLGPVAWTISIGWLVFDLLGPAYRKTIPVILYLGIVSLRDGPEDGDAFWEEEEKV